MTAERVPQPEQAELLATCVVEFRKWLHFPDAGSLYLVLAAVVANRVRDDDPVWPLLVGSPGSGKTEVLNSISHQPDIHQTATLTEPSLLSGTSARERSKSAKGGLLKVIGEYGIIVFKDFGSVLNMNRDARASVLAALREIYDGAWQRNVGTDGGQTLQWEGKIGLIAGCTPTIDSHHAVMGSMGERFVLYRINTTPYDDRQQVLRALQRKGDRAMRAALADAVQPILANAESIDANADQETVVWLSELALLAVRCRSAVERDSYSRDIELIPGPEMPARLGLVLWRLMRALLAIGVSESETNALITKVALDSMPAIRHAVLDELPISGGHVSTSEISLSLNYPTTTARRGLEDLAAHGVIDRHGEGEGKAHTWSLSDWTIERLHAINGTTPEPVEEPAPALRMVPAKPFWETEDEA